MTNHLANVLTVVSDRKIPIDVGNNGTVDYYLADLLSSSDYMPFGGQMPGRNYNGNIYRYGFNGKMKDDEISGSGNNLDFGEREYDSRLGRWWSTDPLMKKYAPISPYVFALNSPIVFMDGDGRIVIGTDGKPVTYERGENGVVKWSANASADAIKVGNAMLSTSFGEKAFNKWQNATTKITIVVDNKSITNDLARTEPTLDGNGELLVSENGQYIEAKVTFFQKKIDADRADNSGKRFEGASEEETLGAVGTHEVFHNEPKQIKLDKKTPTETEQSPDKNLPINSEVNFRKEYQDKHPDQKTKTDKGMRVYEQRGYKGVKEEKK
jgi:RHS repeat-associated protein